MLKFGLSAILLLAAPAAVAQPAITPPPSAPPSTPPPAAPAQPQQQGPTPPPAFIQAAQAFGQCAQTGAAALPATVTPEAGAAQILAGCAAQKTALETQFETWVASPAFPAAGRDIARQQFAAQLGQAQTQLAEAIRAQRAGGQPSN